MKQGCCVVCKLVGILVTIGALNWGLVGLLHKDLVVKLLGNVPHAVRAVYILIGLAGLAKLVCCFKPCPCTGGTCGTEKK